MHGATVNPDPSNRTLCAIGTDTFGPNALALASSCLRKVAQTETKYDFSAKEQLAIY